MVFGDLFINLGDVSFQLGANGRASCVEKRHENIFVAKCLESVFATDAVFQRHFWQARFFFEQFIRPRFFGGEGGKSVRPVKKQEKAETNQNDKTDLFVTEMKQGSHTFQKIMYKMM